MFESLSALVTFVGTQFFASETSVGDMSELRAALGAILYPLLAGAYL
jgi:hypothetical protein